MSYGVLAKALARLRPRQQENEATEALAHVLRTSREAREAFVAVLAASDPTRGPLSDVAEVRTQQRSADTQAQTDLELVDDGGVVLVIVEVKLEAGLHGDQLTSYLEVFCEGGGRLVLLVPSARQDLVWAAALRRLRGSGQLSELASAAGRAVRTADGHSVSLVTWAKALDAVETALPDGERMLRADLEQLRGFIRFSEDTGFRPLQPFELADTTWPRRWIDYTRLVDRTVVRLLGSDAMSFRSASTGRRLKVMGGNGWYFGWFHSNGVWGRITMDASTWMTTGLTPFFVSFQPGNRTSRYVEEALDEWLRITPQRAYRAEDGWLFVPLVPLVDAAEDDVVADLAEQAERIVRRATSRLPAAQTPPVEQPSGVEEVDDEPTPEPPGIGSA